MKPPATIGHVDADCFYVSAERVRHPHLRGLPVGVLGNQGACVIAKSYEMKAHGVQTGTPIWEALPLCRSAVFIKRDFAWYEVLSRKMLSILRHTSPTVEYYSIDEMFFDAVGMAHTEALRLQQRILSEVGVPVSIGVATTKTLAKLASDSSKPFGCLVAVSEEEVADLLQDRPIDDVTGIARRSRRTLETHGIRTCDEFARADRRLIRKILTKRGEDLWWELRGESVLPILTTRPIHKLIARGGSMGKATADPDRVRGFVVRNVERLVEALDYYEFFCERIHLSLQLNSGTGVSRGINLPESTADAELILEAAGKLLPRVWLGRAPVHYMHVIAGRLSTRDKAQLGFFGNRYRPEIARLKRLVNEKIGRFALRSGATLPLVDVYEDEASSYDICDVYGKSCF